MNKVKVDIGIPCNSMQLSQWWLPLMTNVLQEERDGNVQIQHIFALNSAVPDYNKNSIVSSQAFQYLWNPEEKKRYELTDANRTRVTKRFLDGDSDWLFFIDDDTTHPVGTISKLVNLGKPLVGGLYFLPRFPYNPIAYVLDQKGNGMYHAYYGYSKGALTQVDAIGMGCTLIHRSVFEKIMEEHIVFQRADGSIVPIHKSKVKNRKFLPKDRFKEAFVKDGYYHQPIQELPHIEPEYDKRAWPFFGLEYGRTEDLYFCELCANVGIKPWIDTTIVCNHWKMMPTGELDYDRAVQTTKPEEALQEIAKI
jgi:hypothetical protein